MNFWSVRNVQKYYNYKSVFINCQEILCHAALEVLRVHCLNYVAAILNYVVPVTCIMSKIYE